MYENEYIRRIILLTTPCRHGWDCVECCFLYNGYINNYGYGIITIRKAKHLVHRLMFEWIYERHIKAGMQINHYCVEKACWNIHHLYEGTQKQNIVDMWRAKGRKLSDCTIRTVRRRYNMFNDTLDDLAIQFKVSRATISRIINDVPPYNILGELMYRREWIKHEMVSFEENC